MKATKRPGPNGSIITVEMTQVEAKELHKTLGRCATSYEVYEALCRLIYPFE